MASDKLHIVSLSGGMSSAVAAERVVNRYPAESVRLWFANTSWEDENLYEFLSWLESHLGVPIERYQDGRTPLQVAEDAQIIPNQRIAPCTFKLKVEPFVRYIEGLRDEGHDLTVHIGYNWTEPHRVDRTRRAYTELGFESDYPLMWEPVETRSSGEVARDWGISLPRMYRLGYRHNNCGGRCVKQGLRDWKRTLYNFPERYAEVEEWEQEQRQHEGARADYAILRDQSGGEVNPVTLEAYRERVEQEGQNQLELPLMQPVEELTYCVCDGGDPTGAIDTAHAALDGIEEGE